jgi:hypothetical protein
MKKLECFKSAGNVTDAARRIPFSGKPGAAVISGLLVGALLAVGCSKKESKSTGSEAQTSANQMALNQPVMPNPASSASTNTPTPTPKKLVKKRPSTVKYSDQTYGVSFRYPWQYSLKSGDALNSESQPMDFVQPGGEAAVSVNVPKGFYPDTDLASAFFRVNVNKNLSEAECGQFALPQPVPSDQDAVQPSKVGLGGLEMQEVEDITGEEMKQADTKYYHLFQNGACYEFALGLSTESDVNDDGIAPVNREKVFRRLETILATVKIKPEATPQVAAGSVATPTAQDAIVK